MGDSLNSAGWGPGDDPRGAVLDSLAQSKVVGLAGTFQVLLSKLQEGTLPGVRLFGGCPVGQCQGPSGCGHLSKKEGRSGQLQIRRMPRPSRPNPALGSLGAAPEACAKPRPNAPPCGHPYQLGGVNSQGVGGKSGHRLARLRGPAAARNPRGEPEPILVQCGPPSSGSIKHRRTPHARRRPPGPAPWGKGWPPVSITTCARGGRCRPSPASIQNASIFTGALSRQPAKENPRAPGDETG